jgi:ssDNA-binding Zn-finger/Zn-ribbon topoisomerase 1
MKASKLEKNNQPLIIIPEGFRRVIPQNDPKGYRYYWDAIRKREDLEPSDKLVWEALAWRAGKDGNCHPAQGTISEDVGITTPTVFVCLKRLEHKKLLMAVPRKGRARTIKGFNDFYVFLWPDEQEGEYNRHIHPQVEGEYSEEEGELNGYIHGELNGQGTCIKPLNLPLSSQDIGNVGEDKIPAPGDLEREMVIEKKKEIHEGFASLTEQASPADPVVTSFSSENRKTTSSGEEKPQPPEQPELSESSNNCERCGTPKKLFRNSKTGEKFLGCPNWKAHEKHPRHFEAIQKSDWYPEWLAGLAEEEDERDEQESETHGDTHPQNLDANKQRAIFAEEEAKKRELQKIEDARRWREKDYEFKSMRFTKKQVQEYINRTDKTWDDFEEIID